MGDARRESKVIEDGICSFANVGVLAHLDDLELLGSHQTISDFLGFLLIEVAVSHVDLLNILEIREDSADSLGVLERDDLIIDFQDSQFREAFKAGIQVLITVASKDVVNLKLAK